MSVTPAEPEAAGLGSLLRINVRRAMTLGRIYLVIATALSVLASSLLILTTSSPEVTAASIVPFELPIFGVMGSIGALMVFVSDKSKGVYEYLIAYGVETSTISASIVVASLALVALVLGLAGGISATLLAVRTGAVPALYLREILTESVPLAFSASAFMTVAGLLWSAVSSPRTGVNGPVGFAPLLGIGPLLLVLISSALVPAGLRGWYVPGACAALLVLVAVLVLLLSRGAVRERYLSTL